MQDSAFPYYLLSDAPLPLFKIFGQKEPHEVFSLVWQTLDRIPKMHSPRASQWGGMIRHVLSSSNSFIMLHKVFVLVFVFLFVEPAKYPSFILKCWGGVVFVLFVNKVTGQSNTFLGSWTHYFLRHYKIKYKNKSFVGNLHPEFLYCSWKCK